MEIIVLFFCIERKLQWMFECNVYVAKCENMFTVKAIWTFVLWALMEIAHKNKWMKTNR